MASTSLTGALRETLALFDSPVAPRTTSEIADELELGRRSTYDRLDRLVDQGCLRTKKVGANGRVWWRPPTDDDSDREDGHSQFNPLVNAVEEYAIFTLDTEGYVQTWNPGSQRIKGYAEEEIVGEHFSKFYPQEDRDNDELARFLEKAAHEGTIEDEGWRVRADGSRFWASVTISTIRGDDGDLQGFAKVTRDMTERRRAEAERDLLYETTRSIAEAETFEEGLQTALRDVCAVTDWEYADVWMPTDDGPLRRAEAEYYVDDLEGFAAFSEGFTFAPGEGLPGRVYATGEFEWAADIAAGSHEYLRLSEARNAGIQSSLGVPIIADGDVVAVLTFVMRESRETDEQLVNSISSVAVELGELVARRQAQESLERERELIERIFETAPIGISVFGPNGELERANERLEDILGSGTGDATTYTAGDLPVHDASGDSLPFKERPVGRVFETGEPVTSQDVQVQGLDGATRWVSVDATPLTDGDGDVARVIAAATDVTQLKQQAERIECRRAELETELEGIFTRIDDAFYALDDEMRFEYVNDRAEELLGHSEGELLGRIVWEAISVPDDDPIRERFQRAMATQDPVTFERFSDPLGFWETVRVYPSESGLSVYFRDITERKERERELEKANQRFQTLVENFPNGAIALVDQDLRYTTFGGTPEGDTDVTRADLEGEPIREVLPPQIAEVVIPRYEAALEGEPSAFEDTIDDQHYQFRFFPVRDDDGEIFATMAMSQDITERKQYERYLDDAKSQLEAATEAGAVGTFEWQVQEDKMVVGPSFARTFGVDPDAAREGVSLDVFIDAIHEDDWPGVEENLEAALTTCGKYEAEYRVQNVDGEYRWVVAHGEVVCDENGEPETFPGALTDITERKVAELALERHHKRLEALNNLNTVVREITDTVIEQSTREEIEATVCERLAESESYKFAWIAEVDPQTLALDPHVEAGVSGYLEEVPTSMDPDDPSGQGPGGRAIRTQEIQTTQDAMTDPDFEPWREHAKTYGYRSAAGIPIIHDGALYGLLGVYTERPKAFEGQEKDVIGQLGEIVGHAIAATDRKQALMSDELVELDFHMGGILDEISVSMPADERITLDHAVPRGDTEYLVYGTATPGAVDTAHDIVDTVDYWESVEFRGGGDLLGFELVMSDPPVLSTIASLGGHVEEAVVADGDIDLRVHLAPSVDVHEIIDVVKAAYPTAELRRRRQITRTVVDPQRMQRGLLVDLTEKQRATLEAAYHAGFFAWPRDASGEEVADSLGVASPTFHQHLRKAEAKVFDSLLSSTTLT